MYKTVKSKNGHKKFIVYENGIHMGDKFYTRRGCRIDEHPEKIYVFDLDGTIADMEHRVKFIKKPYETGEKDYKRFFEECMYDKPIEWIIDLMRMLERDSIYILSGRNGSTMHETILWLEENSVPYNRLYMRYRTNYERDEILKKRMIEDGIADRIEWIVDDRQRVVDMWRNNGFNVLQCRQWKEKE
jgi:hypothetical protein